MHPSTAYLRASLELWTRRLVYRKKRLAAAQRVGAKQRIEHWHRLVDKAAWHVDKRRAQIHARRPLRLRALDVMLAWAHAGVSEQGANNRGPMVDKIIRAAGGTPGESWCGDTVAAAYIKAGSKIAKAKPRLFAYVPYMRFLPRVVGPRRGHVVGYDFQGDGVEDHTGLFDGWINRKAGTFRAVEGNTGTDGARSDGQGDGVHIRERNVSQVAWFRRVPS